MSKPTQTSERPQWDKLSREEQNLYLRLLWEDAYSEKAIADFLATTKGTIVGRRRIEQITRELDVKSDGRPVNPDRFQNLLEIHKMTELEKAGNVVAIAPVSASYRPGAGERRVLKLATSERTQCEAKDEDNRRCAYEREPNSHYCGLPQHQALEQKGRR